MAEHIRTDRIEFTAQELVRIVRTAGYDVAPEGVIEVMRGEPQRICFVAEQKGVLPDLLGPMTEQDKAGIYPTNPFAESKTQQAQVLSEPSQQTIIASAHGTECHYDLAHDFFKLESVWLVDTGNVLGRQQILPLPTFERPRAPIAEGDVPRYCLKGQQIRFFWPIHLRGPNTLHVIVDYWPKPNGLTEPV